MVGRRERLAGENHLPHRGACLALSTSKASSSPLSATTNILARGQFLQDDDAYALYFTGAGHHCTCFHIAVCGEDSSSLIQISLHFILSFSHEDYGRATSLSKLTGQLKGAESYPPYKDDIPADYYAHQGDTSSPGSPPRRANATFVLLARNSDLNGVVSSMKQMGMSLHPRSSAEPNDLQRTVSTRSTNILTRSSMKSLSPRNSKSTSRRPMSSVLANVHVVGLRN